MKIKVVLSLIFIGVPLCVYSMESEQPQKVKSIILRDGHNSNLSCEIPLTVASVLQTKIPIVDGKPTLIFSVKEREELECIKEYIMYRYNVEVSKNDDKKKPEIEKNFYNYAVTLDVESLVGLTKNVNGIFKQVNEIIPGLEHPFIKKIYSGAICSGEKRSIFDYQLPGNMPATLERKTKNFIQHCQEKQKLLKSKDNRDQSIITTLYAPYSQNLNQVTEFPLYSSLPLFDNGVVAEPACSYVGKDITVYLYRGWGNGLVVYNNINKQIRFFDLPGIAVKDKACAYVFVNNDESHIACSYKSIDGKQKLCVIDHKQEKAQNVDILNEDDQVCYFNEKNYIWGFGAHGSVFVLEEKYSERCIVELDEKPKDLKGIFYNKNTGGLIMWSNSCVFVPGQKAKDFSSYTIERVIIDSSATLLCVKLRSMDWAYQLIDLKNVDNIVSWLHTENYDRPLGEDFSADGNLFITCYTNSMGKDVYRFYDLQTRSFWEKQAQDKILTLGSGKSLEITQNFWSNQLKSVVLVDESMRDGLRFLTRTDYNPYAADSCATVTALSQELPTKNYRHEYPLEVKTLLAARPEASLHVIESPLVSWLRKITPAVLLGGGAALIAALLWRFGTTK
jgi:hypothetical protein